MTSKKSRPLMGNLFGEDRKKNPWKLNGSAEKIVGKLDRHPTTFSRRKKK